MLTARKRRPTEPINLRPQERSNQVAEPALHYKIPSAIWMPINLVALAQTSRRA